MSLGFLLRYCCGRKKCNPLLKIFSSWENDFHSPRWSNEVGWTELLSRSRKREINWTTYLRSSLNPSEIQPRSKCSIDSYRVAEIPKMTQLWLLGRSE